MRRFSQRNSLVTLSDINITPLLDLAFVLLIIFVIISPSIRSSQEHGMELTLPQGGGPMRKVDSKDVRLVEISKQGTFMLDRKPMLVAQIEAELRRTFRINPKLVVKIRADELGHNKETFDIMDRCQRNGISNFSVVTEPRPNR